MARRKPAKKSAKKAARRRPAVKKKAARKKAAKKRVVRKAARKRVARRSAPRRANRTPAAPPAFNRINVITHTEIASADPPATQAWCESVLGWSFTAMPMEGGPPYLMWRFEHGTGGGIRANNPPEVPGSIPYVEVADIQQTYSASLAAGAVEMLPPQELPGAMGWIAIVAAPGGVAFGLWAAK